VCVRVCVCVCVCVLFLPQLVVADSSEFKLCLRKLCCRLKRTKKLYKSVRQQLAVDSSWPPIGVTSTAISQTVTSVVGESGISVAFSNSPAAANGK
jgi:hypothetical protein